MPFSQSTHHAIFGPNRDSFTNFAWLTRYQRKLERLKKAWQQNLGFDLEKEKRKEINTKRKNAWKCCSLYLFILLVNWKSAWEKRTFPKNKNTHLILFKASSPTVSPGCTSRLSTIWARFFAWVLVLIVCPTFNCLSVIGHCTCYLLHSIPVTHFKIATPTL